MNTKKHWKERLYDAYVSSGQAGQELLTSASHVFKSREPYIRHVISKHIPLDKNIPILDLGCGYGAYLFYLKQSGYKNIRGVDTSQEQVSLAQNLGIDGVIHGNIYDFLVNQPDNSARVVMLMDVLEHMQKQELFDVLDEVWRVLESGGRLICHVPNAEGVFGMRILHGDFTHELAFTPKSIHQICSLIGFEEIQCFEDKPVPHNIKGVVRRIIWDVGLLYPRILLVSETGQTHFVLSQNMLVSMCKHDRRIT